MPVFTQYDNEFRERDHADFGQRLFTMSHKRRDGIVLTAVGAACAVAAVVLFVLSKQTEIFVLYACLATFISLLFSIIGLTTLVRSRTIIHVYETGIEKKTGQNIVGMSYDEVTNCKLNYISQGVSTGIGMVLSNGNSKIKIVDNMGRWDTESKMKYTSMANRIASRIPESVKVKGDHAKNAR